MKPLAQRDKLRQIRSCQAVPIVIGFGFGQKGLMYNLTLEGSKFTKLDKR